MSARGRSKFGNLGITRGALILLGINVGVSLLWMMSTPEVRAMLEEWLLATPSNVFQHGRVWTLVTSPFLEPEFLNLVLQGFMMWMFVPTLERFWGTRRFYRFAAVTGILGSAAGVLVGQLLGANVPIHGLSPFTWATVVAFGIVYARQPVQFFGVLPLTGRQMMLGFIGFLVVFVLLQQKWAEGGAYAAAMGAAALLTSKQYNPGLAWKRWKIARARAKLTVLQGGQPGGGGKPAAKRDEQKWLN